MDSGESHTTLSMYFITLNCTIKNDEIGKCLSYIFYHNLKKEAVVFIRFAKTQKVINNQNVPSISHCTQPKELNSCSVLYTLFYIYINIICIYFLPQMSFAYSRTQYKQNHTMLCPASFTQCARFIHVISIHVPFFLLLRSLQGMNIPKTF